MHVRRNLTKRHKLRMMWPTSCHSPVKWSGQALTAEHHHTVSINYNVWADGQQRRKTYLHYRGVKDSGNREKSHARRSERKVHADQLLLSHCYDVMTPVYLEFAALSFQVVSYLWHTRTFISVRILCLTIFTATTIRKWNSWINLIRNDKYCFRNIMRSTENNDTQKKITYTYINSYHAWLYESIFVSFESTTSVTCHRLKDFFFPAEAGLFLLATASTQNLTCTSHLVQWIPEGSCDKVKRAEGETDLSPLSNAEIKNK
jgi:hypothetical protein